MKPETARNWAPPLALCATMIAVAIIVVGLAGIDPSGLPLPYILTSAGMTLLACLVFAFVEIARMARGREDQPVHKVLGQLRPRTRLLLFPALIFPLFLTAFTTAKSGIPFLVGYGWERIWADADAALFGTDVWRLARLVAPAWSLPFWELSYTTGWGAVTYFAIAYSTIRATPERVLAFFTATFATWLIGGWLMAYSMSAAGPVFAHFADPALADRFAPLRHFLAANLAEDGAIRFSQFYLEANRFNPVAVKGGGISAMPSMHLAMAALFVFAAWRTNWLVPALAFWLIIFIGSGLFGYHYWIDGIVGAVIAGASWWAASAYYRNPKAAAGI